jgi:hypothetical protein
VRVDALENIESGYDYESLDKRITQANEKSADMR